MFYRQSMGKIRGAEHGNAYQQLYWDSSPSNDIFMFFPLSCGAIIHLDCFGILELSSVKISAFSQI